MNQFHAMFAPLKPYWSPMTAFMQIIYVRWASLCTKKVLTMAGHNDSYWWKSAWLRDTDLMLLNIGCHILTVPLRSSLKAAMCAVNLIVLHAGKQHVAQNVLQTFKINCMKPPEVSNRKADITEMLICMGLITVTGLLCSGMRAEGDTNSCEGCINKTIQHKDQCQTKICRSISCDNCLQKKEQLERSSSCPCLVPWRLLLKM